MLVTLDGFLKGLNYQILVLADINFAGLSMMRGTFGLMVLRY